MPLWTNAWSVCAVLAVAVACGGSGGDDAAGEAELPCGGEHDDNCIYDPDEHDPHDYEADPEDEEAEGIHMEPLGEEVAMAFQSGLGGGEEQVWVRGRSGQERLVSGWAARAAIGQVPGDASAGSYWDLGGRFGAMHLDREARYLLLTEATRATRAGSAGSAGSAIFPAVPSKLVVVDLETGSVRVSLALGRVTVVRFVSVPGSTLIYALLKDQYLNQLTYRLWELADVGVRQLDIEGETGNGRRSPVRIEHGGRTLVLLTDGKVLEYVGGSPGWVEAEGLDRLGLDGPIVAMGSSGQDGAALCLQTDLGSAPQQPKARARQHLQGLWPLRGGGGLHAGPGVLRRADAHCRAGRRGCGGELRLPERDGA